MWGHKIEAELGTWYRSSDWKSKSKDRRHKTEAELGMQS